MLVKEASPLNPDVVLLLQEAVKNAAVTREQVNTFCNTACNYTLRQLLEAKFILVSNLQANDKFTSMN